MINRVCASVSSVLLVVASLFMVGCTSKVEVRSIDATKQSGIYIVGFSKQQQSRQYFETTLGYHLDKEGFKVFPSHLEIEDVVEAGADEVRTLAASKNAMLILVASPENYEGELKLPLELPTQHRDLAAFYEYQADKDSEFDDSKQAVAEVYAFLVNDERAPYFWSGISLPHHSESKESALNDVAKNLAEALSAARGEITERLQEQED